MKKSLLLLLVICFLLGGSAGCGKEPGDSSTPAPSDTSTTTAGTWTTVDATTTTTGSVTDKSTTTNKSTTTGITQAPTTQKTTQKTTAKTTPKTTVKTTVKEKDPMDALMGVFLAKDPKVKYMPAYDPDSNGGKSGNDWANIKALTYEGADYNGKKTKIFAYLGLPEGASKDNQVPAVVLVHGGGGHAFAEWIKLWTDRGYAAIAMDTTGFFPSATGKGLAGHESDKAAMWQFGLYGDFAEEGYVGGPNNDDMAKSTLPVEKQWMYHAVSGAIIANNVLRSHECVDADKIGITGISWGSVITSIAIGYDQRYAFAVPVYNSAFASESLGYRGATFREPNNQKLWTAEERLDRVDFPVLWMGWANETGVSVNCNSLSYEATKAAGGALIIDAVWGHSHGMGWSPKEPFYFADAIVKGRTPITRVVTEPEGRNFSFTIDPDDSATSITAAIYYITEPMSYSAKQQGQRPTIDQTWKYQTCTVEGNTVTGTVPKSADEYYVEMTTKTENGEKYIITTKLMREIK